MPLAGPSAGSIFRMWRSFVQMSKAAADAAVGADGFGAFDTLFAHRRFYLRHGEDRAVAGFGLDTFDDIDHVVERSARQIGKVSGVAEHRFFHERIARAHRDAVAARDAAGAGNGFAAIPQDARMLRLPIDRQRLVYLEILASFDAASAQNALVGIIAIEGIAVVGWVGLRLIGALSDVSRRAAQWCCARYSFRCCYRRPCNTACDFPGCDRRLRAGPHRRVPTLSSTSMPAVTGVPQARARFPLTWTMQVSQVWMGPSCG